MGGTLSGLESQALFQPGNVWLETHANLIRAGRANVQEQVFRLQAPRHSFPPLFQSSGFVTLVNPDRGSLPVTAARPRRHFTAFPVNALSQKCDWVPWTGVL